MGVTTNTVPLIGVGNPGGSQAGAASSRIAAPMSTTMFNTGARSSVEGYDPSWASGASSPPRWMTSSTGPEPGR